LKDFDRPAYSTSRRHLDEDNLSAQLQSLSSHGRSVSLSDFGEMKRPFSPIEKYSKHGLRNLPSDLDKELKTTSTPRIVGREQFPDRPRSAFVERYGEPRPPFQRPRNPVGKTIENESTTKPAVSTLPHSFKDTARLFNDLGIASSAEPNAKTTDTPTRNHSFRLPDMTGIHSLINTTPKLTKKKYSTAPPKYVHPLNSLPVPQDEKGTKLCYFFLRQI
jgi:hypothetical protein